MKNLCISLSDTLAGKEYAEFLTGYNFSLALDEDGEDFSCTVFQNDCILIAFTYERGFGENISVAEVGSPVDPPSIRARQGGWSLIGEVWEDFYTNYHKVRRELPYPHELTRKQEAILIGEALNSFMLMVKNNEASIGDPKYRMKM